MNVKPVNKLFNEDLVVINMGLESFADNLKDQGVKVLQMNWKPPAGGNKKIASLLARLGR
ncbi:MAG: fdrA domain protein [Spirochaetes bacterium]|nr:fdrA domain protein [Spirochaetota bacterium]